MELNDIQLGIDLATSATIIGSALTFWWQSLKRAEEARAADKIEKTRSIALSKLYDVSREFEDAFIKFNTARETLEDGLYKGSRFSLSGSEIKSPDQIKNNLSLISEFINGYEEYYNLIQKRRYSILPLLDVLDESEKSKAKATDNQSAISKVWEDINSLRVAHSNLVDRFELLTELIELCDKAESIQQSISVGTDRSSAAVVSSKPIVDMARSILFQQKNMFLLNEIISSAEISAKERSDFLNDLGVEWNFREQIVRDVQPAMQERLINHFLLDLTEGEPLDFQVRIMAMVKESLDENQIICKGVLIKLSALLYATLQCDSQESFAQVVDRYGERDYLNKAWEKC
ncbi:hypothetical protein [Motiliproteus sp.]|uniref:hypothetical protein n=1 Tax=Motiliproteus sp. TaxID=1898955 RepID=UPI003BAA27A8